MDKKFDEWNEIKKKTDSINRKIGLKPREIYWVKVGENVGYEQSGKGDEFLRPVIIVRQLNKYLFLGIPTSTTFREESNFFYPFEYKNKKNNIIQVTALIVQLKVFSVKRILSKIGIVNKADFEKIIQKSYELIDPTKR